jgi:RNA polymerase sigma-70 factor (ECF subfamily)
LNLFRRRGASLEDIELAYRRRLPEYSAVAAAILRDPEGGLDAVQETFARAVRSRRRYLADGPLGAWLWRIVVNTALAEARQRSPELVAGPTELGSPDGNGRARLDEVRAAIELLPERQRLTLFLRYYADLDYRAIAQALEVSPGTVAATLNAAHRSLRRQLEEVQT